MDEFIYFEDRDLEFGHGWRDFPFKDLVFYLDEKLYGKDHSLMVCHKDNFFTSMDGRKIPCNGRYTECSYFFITRKSSFIDTKCAAADELRRYDLVQKFPDFRGHDDIEGHFEFNMTPKNTKAYLEKLGIKNGKNINKEKT